ncbi:hypothetical protein F5B22DRAFT_654717 [Xylaria bambusicola]|uniref:uncharacterized protein n=1 Tax=Xylaria bambusicola TaxID=326684 RepID=UPI0020075736|nr:uncharacterized protein F5B22DRAFT_654717 [Xylaria bambusicola]KAI0517473.1 hypothetical protein F5B22DRAFT_654717 [Xylaria bambusicola]
MATATPRIAIIGAGPGGLMLASILHHNNISCTIYERDSSAVARSQGGTLDIHEHSGQQALNAAGLLDKFRATMRLGGEAMKVIKKDGTVLFEDNGEREEEAREDTSDQEGGEATSKFIKGRPEIDRPALKDLLIDSLPANTIHWGKKVTSMAPVPDSKQWRVELDDGSHPAPFDLIIGADGAWSHTRALLTDQQPFYSGVTALDVWVHKVDEVAPDVSSFVGPGNCFLWGEDRALLFQRNGQGNEADARCYACVKTDSRTAPSAHALLGEENEGVEIDWADTRVREKYVDRHFGDWYPEVKRIVLAMTDEPVLRHLYMLPVGLTWESRAGVTLVGDAAHLMTPFAGVGVNVALMDALELAQGIIGCVRTGSVDGEGLTAMLQLYEKGMFARSSVEAAQTEAAMHLQFQENGAEKVVEIMGGGLQPDQIVFE